MDIINEIEKKILESRFKCRELAIYMRSNKFTSINELCKNKFNNALSLFHDLYEIKKKFEDEELSKIVDNYDNSIIEWNIDFDSRNLFYISYDYYKEIKMDDKLKDGFNAEIEFVAVETLREMYSEISLGDEILNDYTLSLYSKIMDRNAYLYKLCEIPDNYKLVWSYSNDFNTIKVGISKNGEE